MVTSRWRMTRSDDRTLRPRTTAVSRDLTVLRPYVLHVYVLRVLVLHVYVLRVLVLRVLVLHILEPRVPEPHVLGHSAELPPVEPGVDGPAARHFTARTGHGSLSCEHHHGAGEAPAAAFDSNLRTAHQRHSVAKARGPPNRRARGIRPALIRSPSALASALPSAQSHVVRSRISRTRSMLVCGCRKANRPTVSPSHFVGGMKATSSSCRACAQLS
jgi:hypothetical protein